MLHLMNDEAHTLNVGVCVPYLSQWWQRKFSQDKGNSIFPSGRRGPMAHFIFHEMAKITGQKAYEPRYEMAEKTRKEWTPPSGGEGMRRASFVTNQLWEFNYTFSFVDPTPQQVRCFSSTDNHGSQALCLILPMQMLRPIKSIPLNM